jgi:hypothetical protein
MSHITYLFLLVTLFIYIIYITATNDTIRRTTHHHRAYGRIGEGILQKLYLRAGAQQIHQQF